MKVTKKEAEIIVHRLECIDGLVEVYNDSYDEEIDWHTMDDVCKNLIAECEYGFIQEPIEGLRRFALEDAAEGCTFFGNMEDAVALKEISKGDFLSYRKAANSLGAKIGVEVTTY